MADRKSLQEKMLQLSRSRELFEQAKSYSFEYLDNVEKRNVFPTDPAQQDLKFFDESLPENSTDPSEMLHMLHQYGSPATVTHTGGRYFGFVIGGVLPPVMAAKWLIDTWDQNSVLYVTSPISSKLEAVSERWLVELLDLPIDTAAGFVSGSSVATMSGLITGRNELLKRSGWDVNSKGLFDAPPIRVILGAEAHSSVSKALSMIGLGKDRVELVPVDEQGRMNASKVPLLDSNSLVILQAGNVNSGSFDPIDEICDKANQANAWVHIDGAFGLWAAASKSKQYLTQGIEKADSWSVDAHKTLNTPYDGGVILCRHREAMASAMQSVGSYILYSENRDGMLYTPEMSRRNRAAEIWATLKVIGRNGVEELVDGLCERSKQFEGLMKENGFQILNEVVFNQILVTCNSAEETSATLRNLQQSGEAWCGGATWHNQNVIRVSVSSWATTEEDIEQTVSAFVIAREESRRKSLVSNFSK